MTVLGRREPRIEDRELLTDGGKYVADLQIAGCAYLFFARSSMAHALIRVDLEEVRKLPGVIAAYSAEDLGLPEMPALATPGTAFDVEGLSRPLLARDRVRFVGEQLAAIVVEDPYLGADAVERVLVDYEPLDPVIDPEAAVDGPTLLFPDAGTNVIASCDFGADGWDGFGDCEVTLTQRLVNHRVLAAPLEVRGCAAEWHSDDKVSVWLSTQAPHLAKMGFVALLRLPPDGVRIRTPAVGGGFGAKGFPYPDELLVPYLARLAGRPLKWVETRTESMMMLTPGRGQVTTVTVGADRSGKIKAIEYDVLQDNGAYAGLGTFMPQVGWLVASGAYDIPRIRLRGRSVVTNTTPTGAYRGAGRPEPNFCLERMMDIVAQEIDLDPAEVRRRNLIQPEQYPFTAATGSVYDSGDLPTAIQRVLTAAGYEKLRAEQERRRVNGDRHRMGIGLSAFVDIAGRFSPPDFGSVEITTAGRVILTTGSSPHGQGHATVWGMIVADRLGVNLDQIDFVSGDTDLVPVGGGTLGSKSLQSAGIAMDRAAVQLAEHGRRYAAQLLEASEVDIVLDTEQGSFHVAGTPSISAGWVELAKAAEEVGDRLRDEAVVPDAAMTFPSGVYLAVVDVDLDTGLVRVERMVTCDDAGRVANPLIAEGQVHGGVAQGIAQALYEELRYDDAGNPLTTNFADYLIVSACELPPFEGQFLETPTDRNELGVKGIGESGTIGATPAVVNAVVDALSEFGIRHLDMPLSPERIWKAIHTNELLARGTS